MAPRRRRLNSLKLPSPALPSPEQRVLPGLNPEQWALLPRVSRDDDTPEPRTVEYTPEQDPAFVSPGAREAPPSEDGEVPEQEGAGALQPSDLLGVGGGVPRRGGDEAAEESAEVKAAEEEAAEEEAAEEEELGMGGSSPPLGYGEAAEEEPGMGGSVPQPGFAEAADGEGQAPLHHAQDEEEADERPQPRRRRRRRPRPQQRFLLPNPAFLIPNPIDPPMEAIRPIGVMNPTLLERILLAPYPEYHVPPPLIQNFIQLDQPAPLTLPFTYPRPKRFFRVQHSATIDRNSRETCPASRTRDSTVLGLTAETIFPPCHERRINRANLERALDPMNVQPTSLVSLYSTYGAAAFDFEILHQMECADVYIAHIAAESFTCGTITVMVTPPGEGEAREVRLPVVGMREPQLLLFSVLSCMEILGMQTEMTVNGVWFAIDSVPAQFIERREARGVALDWSERDGRWAAPGAGQPWEAWGEVGGARFGVDGVEVSDDRPPHDEDMRPPNEGMLPPDNRRTLSASTSVNEEERNRTRSPSSFVDDETPDNEGSVSMVPDETPNTTRSPEVPRVAQGSTGPSAGPSSRARAARASESRDEDEDDDDEDGNGNDEKEGTWMTELQDVVDEELGIVTGDAGDVADAPKSPSLGHRSPILGMFIVDSSQGLW